MTQLKIPRATAKIRYSQININTHTHTQIFFLVVKASCGVHFARRILTVKEVGLENLEGNY